MANPPVEFGINFTQHQPVARMTAWWQAADARGITLLGMPDSPALLRELYVTTAAAVLATRRMRVLTAVTNPVTRHPSVTASAAMTLNEMAPGRIVLGIATGDSALWSTGQKPATLAELREYILVVKGLLRGERVTYRGQSFRQAWPGYTAADVPVFVACAGPKTLRMAAQVADGVIVTTGWGADNLKMTFDAIREGCAEIGRDPAQIEFWSNGQVAFAESREKAMEHSLGWTTSWLTDITTRGKGIPDELVPKVHELNADYRDLETMYKMPDRGRVLVERARRLGIYDWLVEQSPQLWGTVDDVAARIRHFAGLGIRKWFFLYSSAGTYTGGGDADKIAFIDHVAALAQRLGPALPGGKAGLA